VELTVAEFTGVGVGPGDPSFLTLAGARALAEADLVFTPRPRAAERSLAADIAAGAGMDAAKLRPLTFPMTRDGEELRTAWEAAAEPVVAELSAGRKVAFVTLGDPSTYSTWIYLRRSVERLRPGTRCAVVPGIMAANAAAARLGLPLVEGDERMALLPLPEPVEALDVFLPLVDRLVVYKIGSRLAELARWAEARGLGADANLVAGVGLEREKAGALLSFAAAEDGYLSVALIGTGRGKRP
jgi:precorrin-2/cobalt-factor-2 C20-methyltransferase